MAGFDPINARKTEKQAARRKEEKIDWLCRHNLNFRQRTFVLQYLENPNATLAAKKAGYANPKSQGSRMLTNVSIQHALREGSDKIGAVIMVNAEEIARIWWDVATCDMNELVQNIHCPCRFCYGIDHRYQWKTEREFEEATIATAYDLFQEDELRTAAINGEIGSKRLPNNAGGFGYRVLNDPNPECPECAGVGIEVVRFADTRNLSPSARLLYNGVEITKNRKRVKTASREAALERLAKHLGMFAGNRKRETTNPLTLLAQRIMAKAMTVPVSANRAQQVLAKTTRNTVVE